MIWIIISSVVIFAMRAMIMFIGSSIERGKKNPNEDLDYKPSVSIIIPARNEESKIELCVRALMNSDYDKNLFRLYVVNDRSDDRTGEIIDKLSEEFDNLTALHIKSDSEKSNLRGKPGALHYGIQASNGEIIMMTDADCLVNHKWISTVVNRFRNKNVGLVPSYTLIKGESAFDKIQAVEWIYMHTMASAGVGWNNPLGCYGNNLSIRRSVYDMIGGYPNIKFSVTEDLALLKAVFKSGYQVNYLCDYDSTVHTLPTENFKEYISQHKRWAVGGIDLGMNAVLFTLTSLAVWIGLIVALIAFKPVWILAVLFTRIIGDYIIIKPVMNILKENRLYSWIIPAVGFFMLMELIVPPLLLDSRIVWKGQTFNKRS
ncbi:MAG: glycosyltransferase [Candidatus Kapabacteria bacterium]|nr:glycosyltransferase [Candidatus Kapabacteria bacterium]